MVKIHGETFRADGHYKSSEVNKMDEISEKLAKKDLKKMHSFIMKDVRLANAIELKKEGDKNLLNLLVKNLKESGRSPIVDELKSHNVLDSNEKVKDTEIARMKFIQVMLNSYYFKGKNGNKLVVDGKFGENTFWALINYQRENTNNYKDIDLADVNTFLSFQGKKGVKGDEFKDGLAEGIANGRTIYSFFEFKEEPKIKPKEEPKIKPKEESKIKPKKDEAKKEKPYNVEIASVDGKYLNTKKESTEPAEYELDRDYFSGDISKFAEKIESEMIEKIGPELFEEFKKKTKLLSNLNIFMKYMKYYSEQNNDEKLGLFGYGSNYWDNKPIFIEGAFFPSYDKLFGSIMSSIKNGNKQVLKKLLSTLDDDKLLSTLENINGQMLTKYNYMMDMDSPLDKPNERKQVLEMLKKGDITDIEEFFAEEFKESAFIENDVISSVLLKGFNLDDLLDLDLEQASSKLYNKLHYNFYIGGKKIVFGNSGLTKEDVKDILTDARSNSSNLSREQKKQYIYGLLVGKQLSEAEDIIKSQVDPKTKKKLEIYYRHDSEWDKFADRWKSNVMKGTVLLGAAIVTDGLVYSAIPELAILGTMSAAPRFVARVAALQNVLGDTSLLLADKLNTKNALGVATDWKGYIHTAAYMALLEMYSKLGLQFTDKVISLHNFKVYGANVVGLSGIELVNSIVFDGEFGPEEIMNILIFAFLLKGSKKDIKVEKSKNGNIKLIEYKPAEGVKLIEHKPAEGVKLIEHKPKNGNIKLIEYKPKNGAKEVKGKYDLSIKERGLLRGTSNFEGSLKKVGDSVLLDDGLIVKKMSSSGDYRIIDGDKHINVSSFDELREYIIKYRLNGGNKKLLRRKVDLIEHKPKEGVIEKSNNSLTVLEEGLLSGTNSKGLKRPNDIIKYDDGIVIEKGKKLGDYTVISKNGDILIKTTGLNKAKSIKSIKEAILKYRNNYN